MWNIKKFAGKLNMEIFYKYTEHDYPEHALYENGNYENTCIFCKHIFIGLKNMYVCKVCNNNSKKEKQINDKNRYDD